MDIKDYSQNLNQMRDNYQAKERDLKQNYENNNEELKTSFEKRAKELQKNYSNDKTRLEENNAVNNEFYTKKNQDSISESQNKFRNDLKANIDSFDKDRNQMRTNIDNKLNLIKDEYKKSINENEKLHSEAKKNLEERFDNNLKEHKLGTEETLKNINKISNEKMGKYANDNINQNKIRENKHQNEIQDVITNNKNEKKLLIDRFKKDNISQRNSFTQENEDLKMQKDGRIADLLDDSAKASEDHQLKLVNLKDDIDRKFENLNTKTENKQNVSNNNIEKMYRDEINKSKNITEHKDRGSNDVARLKDDKEKMTKIFNEKNKLARIEKNNEIENVHFNALEKESKLRDEFKKSESKNNLKNSESKLDLIEENKEKIRVSKDKNDEIIDIYKNKIKTKNIESEAEINKLKSKSKSQLVDQRVELGNYINKINDNKIDEVSGIKKELDKDKSNFIERSKKNHSDELNSIKKNLNYKITTQDEINEKRLDHIEKEYSKNIENYENKLSQIARKSELQPEKIKQDSEKRRAKDEIDRRNELERINLNHYSEIKDLRDKYEFKIVKDRKLNDQKITRLVQNYEDRLITEKAEVEKNTTLKLNESEAKFERLFKTSEIEKNNMKKEFEQQKEIQRLGLNQKES